MDKKELKKKYKQTIKPMGVYQIVNLVNRKIFIGSSSDLPGKINSQKFQLSLGSHMNQELQNDYKLFGSDNFAFKILDYLEPKDDINYDYTDDLKVLKEMWIEKLSTSSPKGYN